MKEAAALASKAVSKPAGAATAAVPRAARHSFLQRNVANVRDNGHKTPGALARAVAASNRAASFKPVSQVGTWMATPADRKWVDASRATPAKAANRDAQRAVMTLLKPGIPAPCAEECRRVGVKLSVLPDGRISLALSGFRTKSASIAAAAEGAPPCTPVPAKSAIRRGSAGSVSPVPEPFPAALRRRRPSSSCSTAGEDVAEDKPCPGRRCSSEQIRTWPQVVPPSATWSVRFSGGPSSKPAASMCIVRF